MVYLVEKSYQTNAQRFPNENNESLYCFLCPVVVFLSPSSMKAAPAILAAPPGNFRQENS